MTIGTGQALFARVRATLDADTTSRLLFAGACLFFSLWMIWAAVRPLLSADADKVAGTATHPLLAAVRCEGITERGVRCRRMTRDPSRYCPLHRGQARQAEQETVMETAAR